MQLIKNLIKPKHNVFHLGCKCLSSESAESYNLLGQSSLIISKSDSIYRNLALEDWLYNWYPQLNQSSWYHLLLWVNQPCVVIGRHQNPWSEINVGKCQSLGLPIARRNSGGGTVVHDLGNLNLCFLSDRKSYNRKRNNQLIVQVLKKYYAVECEISDRENLITKNGGFKVSGTASKLSSKSAYHHCTLLVNVDLALMNQIIRKECRLFENKATPSVHASVENLHNLCSSVKMSNLIENISKEFVDQFGGRGVVKVEPSDDKFTNLSEIESHLRNWDWIFGKTPKFEIVSADAGHEVRIIVNRGLIEKIETIPKIDFSGLIGVRFTVEDVLSRISGINQSCDHQRLVNNLIIQLVREVYS